MYYSESMIQMVEDLQRQASEMEKQVKDMLEIEGRACGIELDKRKNARDLYLELQKHQGAIIEAQPMTWAYIPQEMCSEANVYAEPAFVDIDEPVMHEPVVEEANVMPEEHMVEEANVDMPPHDDVHYEDADADVHVDHVEPEQGNI